MTRKKQILVGVAATFAVVFILAGVKFFQVKAAIARHSDFQPPPEAITTTTAQVTEWPRRASSVGTLAPVNGVMLGAEVLGKVKSIPAISGQEVEKGDLIIETDSDVEKAQLMDAEARLERSKKRLTRYEGIKDTKALSPETLDDARMEFRQAEATVNSLRALIERKNIIAPFAGKLGIIRVNRGQILIPGTELLSLQALDPLRVYFSLPQKFLPELNSGAEISVQTDAYPEDSFSGSITSIEPNVSEETRNILIQGTVPNTDRKLRAGMFVNVTVTLPGTLRSIVLPASSIQYAPYGDSVYVIEELFDEKGRKYLGANTKIVKVGERRGDLVAIESGLSAGEIVATSGVFKLRPRAAVQINNSLSPAQELNPKVSDS